MTTYTKSTQSTPTKPDLNASQLVAFVADAIRLSSRHPAAVSSTATAAAEQYREIRLVLRTHAIEDPGVATTAATSSPTSGMSSSA